MCIYYTCLNYTLDETTNLGTEEQTKVKRIFEKNKQIAEYVSQERPRTMRLIVKLFSSYLIWYNDSITNN